MPHRFTKRFLRRALLSAVMLSLVLTGQVPVLTNQANASEQSPAAFARTEFEQLWNRADSPVAQGAVSRSWLWGPAPGVVLTEPFGSGSRTVQYFDKARMELNTSVTDPSSEWRVTTGLLVSEMVQGRVQTGANQFTSLSPSREAVAGDSGVLGNPSYADFNRLAATQSVDRIGQAVAEHFAPGRAVSMGTDGGVKYAAFVRDTAHNIPDVFLNFMTSSGPVADTEGSITSGPLFDWVYVMGYPITEPYWVDLTISGKKYSALIQLFQRRVLTYVPDFPAGWQVQMGNVGQHYYNWRYPSSIAAAATPARALTPAPTATAPTAFPATGGFVGTNGSNFTYRGGNIKLKGTNYWMQNEPFVGTWSEWDGPRVLAELKQAHDLGVNTIRVGLPYDHLFTMDIVWGGDKKLTHISDRILNDMTQLLQIASSYNMKVIFVLFEWYDKYPDQGSGDERSNIIYLQGIVGHFANDDRVLAWDLHNEPDNYGEWQGGNPDKVIKWLQRIAGYVRSLDSHHPITVGVGDYKNLWTSAHDGTTILSFTDFAAFHCYDAGALGSQIAEIKAHTGKPILLEEMGWPTKPGDKPPAGAVFNEAQQNFLYTTMLNVSASSGIAGVVQWTLFDFPPTSTNGGKFASYEENFGLVRLDGSLKPAAAIFRNAYTAPGMTSDTVTSVHLSKEQ